jgi:hypothetical protein
MNHKTIMLALLVSCLIPLLPASARAQNGWVLWQKTETTTSSTMQQHVSWELLDAYPEYDRCTQVATKVWQVSKDRWTEDKQKYGTISEIKEVPSVLIIVTFKDPKKIRSVSEKFFCLPGTLDPRERK